MASSEIQSALLSIRALRLRAKDNKNRTATYLKMARTKTASLSSESGLSYDEIAQRISRIK